MFHILFQGSQTHVTAAITWKMLQCNVVSYSTLEPSIRTAQVQDTCPMSCRTVMTSGVQRVFTRIVLFILTLGVSIEMEVFSKPNIMSIWSYGPLSLWNE